MSTQSNGKAAQTAAPATPAEGFSLISNEKLLALYTSLVRCRTAGTLRGYEAGMVAAALDLGPADSFVAANSAVSARVVKTIFPDSKFNLFPIPAARNGGEPGLLSMASDQFHSILGAALAAKSRKDGSILVVFSTGEPAGHWHDALDIAVAHSLPLIFVNQARRRAVAAKAGRPFGKAKPLADPTHPYLPAIPVDAGDLVAIYRVASEGISRARKGRGPTLIECVPVHAALRAASGNRKSASTDTVLAMENYLRRKNLFTSQLKREAASS